MTRRVVLHVGPSKTGTTTIQAGLSALGREFRCHGVLYPTTTPPSTEGHPSLAREAREAVGQVVPRTSAAECTWGEVIAGFEASDAHTLLLSSEDFSDLTADQWGWVSSQLSKYSVWVVLALRSPIEVVPSAWKQSVKWGFGCGEEVLDLDAAVDILTMLPRVRITDLVDRVQEVLHPDRVRLFTLGKSMSAADLLRRFAQAAALPDAATQSLASLTLKSANLSLSDWKTALMLRVNQALLSKDPESITYPGNLKQIRLQSRRYILDLLNEMPDRPGFRIGLSAAAMTKLRNLGQHVVKWAADKDVIGDLSDLTRAVTTLEHAEDGPPTEADIIALLMRGLSSQIEKYNSLASYSNGMTADRDAWRTKYEKQDMLFRLLSQDVNVASSSLANVQSRLAEGEPKLR